MKKTSDWHHTLAGSIILWLGSIKLAVPVLIFTAAALALGTYLDSTRGAQVARQAVYGSWWFMGLMGLVCVSLVFAVISRYPWKRRHVGFMTVHAGLIALIFGGFWSLFGRVEGRLALEEGTTSTVIETTDDQLELVEHQAGTFTTLADTPAPHRPVTLTLAGTRLQVVERWENSREEEIVNNDAPFPFRGVRLSPQQGTAPTWVGEEERGGGAPVIAGLRIRVLPDGATWEPEAAPTAPKPPGYEFIVGAKHFPLADLGLEAFPGWTITAIKSYSRAMVAADGLTEMSSGPDNPAVDVTLSDGRGTVERHTAFLNFSDMVMNRTLEGAARSDARLVPAAAPPAAGLEDTLVIYGPIAQTRAAFIAADGKITRFDDPAPLPRTLDVGTRQINLLQQYDRARGGWKTLQAPRAADNRPALLVRIGDATELTILAWKGMAPVPAGERNLMLRYGPRHVPLPFSVRLDDFRKTDYPGTEMAMAYESDVTISLPDQPETAFRIHMNHPFAHGPWKVYQSGFVGDTVSIFSVMRDPGLPLTYIASAVLCLGIVLTFFSRSLSWGHPGIPVGFAEKEPSYATPPPPPPAPAPGVAPVLYPASVGGA